MSTGASSASGGKSSSSKDEALARVQSQLDAAKDARREERFYWICTVIFLFDIFQFKDMETWSSPLVIGFLQFIFIVALGRRLGVDNIWTLTERIIEKWNGAIGRPGGD